MGISCGLCNKNVDVVYAYQDMEMCEDCFKHLISIMQYKFIDDMIEEDKVLLMKFCNKLVKQLFDDIGCQNETETDEEEYSK